MASQMELEVYQAIRDNQTSGTYYVSTAAGAGIALAVNQTHGLKLSWSQAPLGAAVMSWAFSFFLGYRYLSWASATLLANAALFPVMRGQDPELGTHEKIAAAREGILQAAEYNSTRGNVCAIWQFRMLIAGGVLYVAWHVLEMYLRTLLK